MFTNSGTLSNAASFTSAGTFINSGTVVGGGTFLQTGGVSQIDGSFTQSQLTLQGGQLFGQGTITGALLNSGGTIQGGAAGTPGTLTVDGGFTEGASGTWQEFIGGSGQYSVLSIAGNVSLDGTLNIVTGNGFNFAGGETYDIATFNPGGLTGSFAKLVFGGYSATGSSLDIGNGVTLNVRYNYDLGNIQLSVAAVPEPAESSMLLTGFGLIGMLQWRRRSRWIRSA
jgi:hypothetical protein